MAMRSNISFEVTATERARLEALVSDGKTLQKHLWRARIVLLAADGIGTVGIMRRTGKSKPTVWRWQEPFMEEAVDGLLHDKTRPPGRAPLAPDVIKRIVAMTHEEPPGEATHWTFQSALARWPVVPELVPLLVPRGSVTRWRATWAASLGGGKPQFR